MSGMGVRMVTAVASAIRGVGKSLDKAGANMEVAKYSEKLVPSTRFVAVDGVAPRVAEYGTFVAPSASVIGDVTIGRNSSIWYGSTVRGDVNTVSIGERTAIMDRAVIHVAKIQGDSPTNIGNNVTVGAGALIHAATVKDLCVIGESAQVLDGALVESNSIVDVGAVVTPGTVVPGGELWAGAPAKKVRELTAEEIASIPQKARDALELASMHAVENSKDYAQVQEEEDWIDFLEDTQEDDPHRTPPPGDIDDIQGMGHPGRIFNSTLTHPEEGIKK
ncbi:Gamma carbonic anhydrase [Seminavis robusta]|uniref:Gamma carbonic anhydrase n=1 Tax=Seminavis robusta TaxID=568900 RepID=A0A9N8H4N6_9STRA|nr:Gamma carbonic anhydrase [Seminavis robusta]|eukprot:Sro68_g037840.1 Gamma carbonic anhydrase (277) ;mRNA; f:2872-3702